MVHFASAGNSGSSVLAYPASIPGVNAVAAANRLGQRASFSQYGTGLAFIAPGQEILTTDRTASDGYGSGELATMNGTSFASPYAAGVAALICSTHPDFTVAQVERRMQTTALDMGPLGYDTGYGYGMLHAGRAVSAVTQEGLTGTYVGSVTTLFPSANTTVTSPGVQVVIGNPLEPLNSPGQVEGNPFHLTVKTAGVNQPGAVYAESAYLSRNTNPTAPEWFVIKDWNINWKTPTISAAKM